MDESLQQLENELKALRPRRPSPLLRARVEHALASDVSVAPAAPAAYTPAPAKPAPRYTSATTLRSWKWFSWQMAAAAAVALVVSLGVWRYGARSGSDGSVAPLAAVAQPGTSASTAPDISATAPSAERMLAAAAPAASGAFRPVKAANVLYDLRDEGPVLLEDNSAGRRVRARYVDTYTWRNPATNASLKWSVPRDEVRVLPANYH
ncbi:MAG: hypothetical protein NDI75_07980 [Candidatus Didemnitutus sp.]|nr:hypothetical protein [Candidatus Didemnitutus sp.]